MKDVKIENCGGDPFKAIPIVSSGVDAKVDPVGCYNLRRRIEPKSKISRFLSQHLNWHRDALINLDSTGSAFWKLINGERTLEEIEKALRKETSLKEDDCRKAVLLFTRDLMMRGLISLKVNSNEAVASNGTDKS